MTFQFNGQTYRLVFHHDKPLKEVECSCFCGHRHRHIYNRQTTCRILRRNPTALSPRAEWDEVARGRGTVHPKDVFTKEGGRGASLRYALEMVRVPLSPTEYREFSKAAWDAYRNRNRDGGIPLSTIQEYDSSMDTRISPEPIFPDPPKQKSFPNPSGALSQLMKDNSTYLESQNGSVVAQCTICRRDITNRELHGIPNNGEGTVCVDCIDAHSASTQRGQDE